MAIYFKWKPWHTQREKIIVLWSAKAAESARVKSWEIIADNLKKRGLEPGLGLGRLIPRGEQSGLDKSLTGWISQMAIMHPSSRRGSEGNNAVTFRIRHGPKIFEIFSC
jgi:hypothetical protein